jgi:hypothetical protein
MTNFILTLTAPKEYGVEAFDADASIWTETDDTKTEAGRYVSDPIRNSVMQFAGKIWTLGDGKALGDDMVLGDSPEGMDEGVYRDYNVTPGVRYSFACLYRMESGALSIELYDQTNGTIIESVQRTNATWRSYETSIIAPEGCNTIRVKYLQSQSDIKPGPFYIDNVSLSGNILIQGPDSYSRIPERVGYFHQTLGGRRVYDLRAIHYSLHLVWNIFKADQYENLREAYYSNELLYFDDGDVPPLIESERVYDTEEYDYIGITNPSDTHKSYFASSSSLPTAKADFEVSEFSTSDYQAIDVDDSNYKETNNPNADEYLYHKFVFLSSIYGDSVKRFRIKVAMSGSDLSPQNMDGGILYAWNGTNWVELARNTSSGKSELSYSTATPEVARQFVDSSDKYIRLLLRSRNRRNGTNGLSLRTYYVECEINEGLDLTIDLSHKTILDENDDVIWVKNITQGNILEVGSDYVISNDRRSITVSGQSSGDEIQVKYRRYFEVMFASIPEDWLNGDPSYGEASRSAEIVLETLSESR